MASENRETDGAATEIPSDPGRQNQIASVVGRNPRCVPLKCRIERALWKFAQFIGVI